MSDFYKVLEVMCETVAQSDTCVFINDDSFDDCEVCPLFLICCDKKEMFGYMKDLAKEEFGNKIWTISDLKD